MNAHEKINEMLAGYALQELTDDQSNEVKQHLDQCPQCKEELNRLETVLGCAESMSQLSADSQSCESAKQAVFNKVENEEKATQTPRPYNRLEIIRRTIMKSPITKLAAAAVIVIAVFIAINQLSGNGASSVFASVVEQIHNARTMTYSVVTQTPVENMPTVRTEMAFKEPAYMRTTTADGFITVMDLTQVRGISIWPPRRQFINFEASKFRHDPAKDPFMVVESLKAIPYEADQVLGKKDIDGRVLQGFRVVEDSVVNTVWIDPKTRELVRVEMEFTNAPGMNKIMTDFQFDVELDDSLFSLTPPEGYMPLEVQADVSKVAEQDLIEYLRSWSSWTKNGTFPPMLVGPELPKIATEMVKQGKFGKGETTQQQRDQDAKIMFRGMMFVAQLPAESNWRYAGENVSYGDADTAIFWYCPEGAKTYRVIYGDLSVKDVAPEDLPK